MVQRHANVSKSCENRGSAAKEAWSVAPAIVHTGVQEKTF